MEKKIELTPTQELLKLVAANPELPILPMVHGEVCEDDSHYWSAEITRCEVNEYVIYGFDYGDTPRVIFKDDTDDLYEELFDEYWREIERETICEREREEYAERKALERIDSLAWKKAIILFIG